MNNKFSKWAKVLKPFIDARKIEGKPLRDSVWKDLEPLRKAIGYKDK